MGIDVSAMAFLMMNKKYVKGDVLQLGRQGMHLGWNQVDANNGRKVFEAMDTENKFQDIFSTNPHADGFFTYLGADKVDSMDYSDFEQASIVHDLNNPVPKELENKFDFIYDGGTIEHIYDVKTVMENIKKMLKLNGIFAGLAVGNNSLGHGFYQFSPELYRTVFSEEAGYQIHSLQLIENTDIPNFIDLPTPPKGERQEMRTKDVPIYVCFIIEKIKEVSDTKNFQQSDYLKNWGEL